MMVAKGGDDQEISSDSKHGTLCSNERTKGGDTGRHFSNDDGGVFIQA